MGAWRRRLNWRLLRVALAISISCLFAPAQARASCGDYVTVGSDSGHSTPNHTETSPTRKRVPPCHGPSCSNLPASDPLATAPAAPSSDREWAALAFPIIGPEPRPLDLPAECSARHAVRRGGSVFHPPRTTSTSFLP
jgi:hypothetical protein